MAGGLTDASVALLARYVRHALAGAALDNATVRRFEEPLRRLRPAHRQGDGRRRLPVLDHWGRAVAAAPLSLRPLLASLGPALAWTRNPNYRGRPDSRFLARYGYGVILGPADSLARPLIGDASASMGLLMLGPDVHYPRHRHPAEEIYLPLAGTAWWQSGDAPWRPVPAGTAIHHPSGMPHATRTVGVPLLALYIWRGDIGTHARLAPSGA